MFWTRVGGKSETWQRHRRTCCFWKPLGPYSFGSKIFGVVWMPSRPKSMDLGIFEHRPSEASGLREMCRHHLQKEGVWCCGATRQSFPTGVSGLVCLVFSLCLGVALVEEVNSVKMDLETKDHVAQKQCHHLSDLVLLWALSKLYTL